MIEKLRRELWESIFLNPVTPEQLLKNLQDPDYKSVKSFSNEEGVRVELSFIDNKDYITAIYEFDNREFLQKAFMIERGIETIIFDRQKQIKDILKAINTISSTKEILTA